VTPVVRLEPESLGLDVMKGRPLAELVPTGGRLVGDGAVEVLDVVQDSAAVRSGSLFCCVRGHRFDGHDFAGEAIGNGASALLVERQIPGVTVPQIVVSDVRASVGFVASLVHGSPSASMTMVGITGTNGKTTTAHMIASVFRAAGHVTEVVGTLSGGFTTPEASDLQRILARFVERGVDAVAMEVSSHALQLGRVNGTRFAAGVFTNLGRDHLDFHGDMEAYFLAKARLFDGDFCDHAVVNADDPWGRRIIDRVGSGCVTFSLDDVSELAVTAVGHSYVWRGSRLEVPIGGSVNVMNSLAAATVAATIGIESSAIVAGLASMGSVSGRFQRVEAGQDFVILVDYAHTPDGLAAVLRSIRDSVGGGRIHTVFGCGGDRDKAKRPLMGEVAVSLSDSVIVTSDNPRSEDPAAIAASVVAGVPDHLRHRLVGVLLDRREAIARAVRGARVGDVVLIAGKGHETTQVTGATVVDFDDRVVAAECVEALR